VGGVSYQVLQRVTGRRETRRINLPVVPWEPDIPSTVLYIPEWGSSSFLNRYTSEGEYIDTWSWELPEEGPVQYFFNGGVAIDKNKNLYFSNVDSSTELGVVGVLDADGNFVKNIGQGVFETRNLNGVAVDSSGCVYVSETAKHRVVKFKSTGAFALFLGSENVNEEDPGCALYPGWGSGDGMFKYPNGIGIDTLGNIYVVDNGNSRIQKFNSNGQYLLQWGNYGSGEGEFDVPWGIACDPAGYLYVGDKNNHRVQKFDQGGNFITQWTGIVSARGIAIDKNGIVFVSSDGIWTIAFDPEGVEIRRWLKQVYNLCCHPNNVY